MLKLPNFLGFDELFEMANRMQSVKLPAWPPYNVRKTSDNQYVIEMAVAGFGSNDVEVTLDGDQLVIRGHVDTKETDDNYLFKGIAQRSFERTFRLNDNIVIKNATLLNGILKVFYDTVAKQPATRKIEVKSEE